MDITEARRIVKQMMNRSKKNVEGNLDYDMFTEPQYVALRTLVYYGRVKGMHYQLSGEK